MEELWGTNFKIINNTDYDMVCSGSNYYNPIIYTGQTVEWTEIPKELSLTFSFSGESGVYMVSTVSYGSTIGVNADRGFLVSQDIELFMEILGFEYASETQSNNEDTITFPWNIYSNGGNITLIYNKIV